MLKTTIRQKAITAYNLVSNKIIGVLDKWVPTIINFLLKKIARKTEINPSLLFTENRKDVEYRLSFLKDVVIKKVNPKKTKYYAFVMSLDPSYNPDLKCKEFLEICDDIKKNCMKEPVYILKVPKKTVKTRYFHNGQKYWKEYKNKTKYQIFDGAHRVAIAIFLGYEKMPCKTIKPVGFEIPDYTCYIERRGKIYDALINNPKLLDLHKSLNKSLSKYSEQFGRGGFYQSLESIHIIGQRPTEERFKKYTLKKYLKKDQRVLDIGSNCGFFSLYTSQFVGSVDSIEIEKSFVEIASKVKRFLGAENCNFFRVGFKEFRPEHKYDVVLSLAIHLWVDMDLKCYLNKIDQILNKNGILLLESHNIEEERDFDKNVRNVYGNRFVVEKRGTLIDDEIIKREFMILRKKN